MSTNSGKLLVIGHVWPEPLATAAGKRMLQLLCLWKDWGALVCFASAAAKTAYSFDLSKSGIDEIPINLNDPSFDQMINNLNPGVVMFDRFMTEEQYGWRVAEQLPNCIRILNTEDLHSLRQVRRGSLDQFTVDLRNEWLKADITKRELASIYRSDLSLIISSFEERWLKDQAGIPGELLAYVPFMYNETEILEIDNLPGYEDRRDFVFVGNGKHQPNLDAIRWLQNELWPGIIKELPEANLHIYGAYLPQNIMDFHNPDLGFLVHGWAEDIQGVLSNTRLNLVPLRFGAGLKGKFLDAMICGTPSITTQIGSEGILKNVDDGYTSADEKKDFVTEALHLYRDKQAWEEHLLKERKLLSELFQKQPHSLKLKDRIAYLAAHLDDHRRQNVVGSILHHQTLNSTKYLAKWIEAKNELL